MHAPPRLCDVPPVRHRRRVQKAGRRRVRNPHALGVLKHGRRDVERRVASTRVGSEERLRGGAAAAAVTGRRVERAHAGDAARGSRIRVRRVERVIEEARRRCDASPEVRDDRRRVHRRAAVAQNGPDGDPPPLRPRHVEQGSVWRIRATQGRVRMGAEGVAQPDLTRCRQICRDADDDSAHARRVSRCDCGRQTSRIVAREGEEAPVARAGERRTRGSQRPRGHRAAVQRTHRGRTPCLRGDPHGEQLGEPQGVERRAGAPRRVRRCVVHYPHGRCSDIPRQGCTYNDNCKRKRRSVVRRKRHREEARRRLSRPHDQPQIRVLVGAIRPRVEFVKIVVVPAKIGKVCGAIRGRDRRCDGLIYVARSRLSDAARPAPSLPRLIGLVATNCAVMYKAAAPSRSHYGKWPTNTWSVCGARRPPSPRIDAVVSIVVVAVRVRVTTTTERIRRDELEADAQQCLRLLRRRHVAGKRFYDRCRGRRRDAVADAAEAPRCLHIADVS